MSDMLMQRSKGSAYDPRLPSTLGAWRVGHGPYSVSPDSRRRDMR